MMDSLQKIRHKVSTNAAIVDTRAVPMNGNLGSPFSGTTINSVDRLILRSCIEVTKNIAGVNPLSNKFVLKESENNLNLALAHLNMPNA